LLRQVFGLNAYEARVYISLLGRRMKAKEVAEESGVPQSRVYDVLRSLVRKGFADETEDGFRATRPSVALETRLASLSIQFDEQQAARRRAKEEVVRELEPVFLAGGEERTTAVVLKGMDSIASAFIDVLGRARDVYLLVKKGAEARKTFLEYLSAAGRDARVRMILPLRLKVGEGDMKKLKEAGVEVRRSPGIVMDMMVGGESDVIIGVPTSGREAFEAMAVWVRNSAFASSVRESVEQIWRESRQA
jgi:sugar-specific transcriptional regulator TrmB